MNAIAEKPAQEVAIVSETASIMAVIAKAASDPNTDVGKLEKLVDLYERINAGKAKIAYAAAFADMQAELPVIAERGHITVRAKGKDGARDGEIQQDTSYALWEDINEEIRPILAKHRFGLSFRTGATSEGRVTITAVLLHADGYQEETTIALMHDSTGSKNSVQAIGSSTSYGKRYAASALLNLTSRGQASEDDDGAQAGKPMSKATARPIDGEMRKELSACSTVDELNRLWKSKPFQIELERLPLDWKQSMIEHAAEVKADLLKAAPPAYVAPDFDFPGDRP